MSTLRSYAASWIRLGRCGRPGLLLLRRPWPLIRRRSALAVLNDSDEEVFQRFTHGYERHQPSAIADNGVDEFWDRVLILNAGVDELAIGGDESAPELSKRLSEAGAALIVSTLGKLEREEIMPQPQDNSQATLARPLKKEDGATDWSLAAPQIYNRIRGLDPWPGMHTTFRGQAMQFWGRPNSSNEGAGEPGTIHVTHGEVLAACGESTWLRLTDVKLEGRKRMAARDFANGARLQPNEKLGA